MHVQHIPIHWGCPVPSWGLCNMRVYACVCIWTHRHSSKAFIFWARKGGSFAQTSDSTLIRCMIFALSLIYTCVTAYMRAKSSHVKFFVLTFVSTNTRLILRMRTTDLCKTFIQEERAKAPKRVAWISGWRDGESLQENHGRLSLSKPWLPVCFVSHRPTYFHIYWYFH